MTPAEARKKTLCPTCRQDMREGPRHGNSGRDCPQCGQGMSKTTAQRRRIAIEVARKSKARGKRK